MGGKNTFDGNVACSEKLPVPHTFTEQTIKKGESSREDHDEGRNSPTDHWLGFHQFLKAEWEARISSPYVYHVRMFKMPAQ